MIEDSYIRYFFNQIELDEKNLEKLNSLNIFAKSIPSTGLSYEYRDYTITEQADFTLRMDLYWRETLSRVHYASVISQLRANAWFNGVLLGVSNQNLHSFAACLRGLIESVADSNYSLIWVPKHLDDKKLIINDALNKNADINLYEDYLDEKLETTLIHFSHAKGVRNGEIVPDLKKHKAKGTWEYLKELPLNHKEIVQKAYDELCQITHPSSESNLPFTLIRHDEPSLSIYEVRNDLSIAHIIGFSIKHKKLFPVLIELSTVSPKLCLETLAKLNYHPFSDFKPA